MNILILFLIGILLLLASIFEEKWPKMIYAGYAGWVCINLSGILFCIDIRRESHQYQIKSVKHVILKPNEYEIFKTKSGVWIIYKEGVSITTKMSDFSVIKTTECEYNNTCYDSYSIKEGEY